MRRLGLVAILAILAAGCARENYPEVTKVTRSNFRQLVIDNPQPVMIDVWAKWCGPCRGMDPTIAEIAHDMRDRVTVVKLDADADPELVQLLRVEGFPTFLFVQDGKIVQRMTGTRHRDELVGQFVAMLQQAETSKPEPAAEEASPAADEAENETASL